MDPDEVRDDWAGRSGRYSPQYYADLGPNQVSETLLEVFDHYADTDARILELGCGSGRHLETLREHGYENLTGIDINEDSFDVMDEAYPTLADLGTFHAGAIEDILPDYETDAFDAVYSVETLQHIHPDDTWVFDEVVRVCGDLLVTAENEGNSPTRGRGDSETSCVDGEFPLYHRNWKQVFGERDCAQLLREPTSRDTIRVFRTP